jgi:membrane associated rhomboid family serine protease
MKIEQVRLLLVTTAIFLASTFAVSLAYGATNSTSTTPVTGASLSVLDIVVGIASGGFYGLLGYYTDLEKNPLEKFNQKQFLLTVGIGAIVGLFIPITAPADLPTLIGTATTAFGSFGAIYFIQKLVLIAHTLSPPKPASP